MLNAEKTSAGTCPVAHDANGTNGANGSSGSKPPRPQHSMYLTRAPGPASWKGLPPGPKMPYPLQILAFLHRRRPWLEKCRKNYGSPFTVPYRVPPVPAVVIFKPDQIKQVFHAPPDVLYAADGSSDIHKYFGSPGLAYFDEDEHLVRRKLVNRSLHGEAMTRLVPEVASVIESELDSFPVGEYTELFPRFRRLAVNVMRYGAFGPEPDERLDRLVTLISDELYATADTPLALIEDQYLSPRAIGVLKRMPPYRRILETRDRADEIIYDVIEDRRRNGGGAGTDTLSVLLAGANEDGSPISDHEIRNDIMSNLLAGSATTAASMAWAVERLAKQPETRARLVGEIDEGREDAYALATVQEVLRRKPPLPAPIPRLVRKPFELGGYVLPPGVRIVCSGSLLHHDPEIYPDPYAFKPERFLDNPPGNYTWIPFGGGRRRCIGKGIAEHEIKTLLQHFFRRFDVEADTQAWEKDAPIIAAIRPSPGCRVKLSPRS